ncbi:MAG: TonB-dependent receptor [Candidatus Marinimicrobia bacterium]|nr:TonB-dependent receptor [Candidatus Neomarinimicrobiota bacterium]
MKKYSAFLLLIFSLALNVMASTGGKISGFIMTESGEPLMGANIMLEDTYFGTASSESGHFYLLNIPPGKYSVKFMMMGYKTYIQKEILVKSDFTTQLDITMAVNVLQSGEEVIVIAERPLIQKDATSKIQVVGEDEIVNLPVEDFKDILATQAGFTTDANNEIHVRGGRSNEILYMIDGIIVDDPMGGGYDGTVNQNAIQEMSIISGAFNAEYGKAMSSIVNIVTKDGSDHFTGKIEYISDQLNESIYHSQGAFDEVIDTNFQYIDLAESLYDIYENAPENFYLTPIIPFLNIPIKGKLNVSLGGKIPLINTYFFMSGLYSQIDSPLPHGANIRQDYQVKLTKNFTNKIKLFGTMHSSTYLYQNYSHDWKYLPENNTHTFKVNDRYSLNLTHTLNQSTYYNMSLSRTNINSKVSTSGFLPDSLIKPIYDESFAFYGSGNNGNYSEHNSIKNALKLDFTSQINSRHLVRSGLTYDLHDLDILTINEPWESGKNFEDDTTFSPVEASFYLQDKIEYDFLIINVGLRYDRLNPMASMWENVEQFVVKDSSGQYVSSPIEDAGVNAKWSPRIGIAYPVTENTVFHFSYGHFFQNPGFSSYYYNANREISSTLPLVGNPKVKSQKTVTFETGLKQTLSENSVLEVSAWMKDIRDLLSTKQIRYLSNQYILYTNSDYASVKGMDFTLRADSRYIGGSVNYTFSVAKGSNSTPMGGYFDAYENEEIPHEEFYLDFDQRHDIALDLNAMIPKMSGSFLGKIIQYSTLNVLLNAASGLPYTPYIDFGARVEQNSERQPWTYSLDFRLKKTFHIGSFKLGSYIEGKNITDHRNVMFVYSRTGEPFNPGISGVGTSLDSNYNPARLGPLRAFKIGTYINW